MSRADDGAEDVEHGHVPVADPMQHDDVPYKVCVALLPEWFFALAPDGGDDGGDIERQRIGVRIIVERVIADVAGERDFDVILDASAAASVSFAPDGRGRL